MTVVKFIDNNGATDCQYECCPSCLGFDVVVECKETIAYLSRWYDNEHPFEDYRIQHVWFQIGGTRLDEQWLDLKPSLDSAMLREIAAYFKPVEIDPDPDALGDILYDQMRDDELCKSN
jgi:hypothetical protein